MDVITKLSGDSGPVYPQQFIDENTPRIGTDRSEILALSAENARLKERLAQAEGLLREWKAAFFDEGRSYPLVETHYFLHLEQEKKI